MSDKEMAEFIQDLERFRAKVTKSRAASRRFLRSIGVIDKRGKLTGKYDPYSNTFK